MIRTEYLFGFIDFLFVEMGILLGRGWEVNPMIFVLGFFLYLIISILNNKSGYCSEVVETIFDRIFSYDVKFMSKNYESFPKL